ncbi:MAG: efflux RND transporter permease subunit [Calditrichaeota bacterium]|nr:efflux RND transporter permease subunit [Calditrichota bacterium]
MKSVLKILLKRPISILMFYLGLLILGSISLKELDISLLPPLNFPQISVHVIYPNSSPEEVEQTITRYLEEAFSTINGVTDVQSRSMAGEALIIIKFAWGTDMKYAALNVRQQADRVYSFFPQGALRPVVNMKQPQNRPIVTIALSESPLPELKRFAEYVVKKRLEQISGVAEAAIIGAPVREIKVLIEPNILGRQGFTLKDIELALKNNNLIVSAGSIKKGDFKLALRINSELQSVEDISKIPVLHKSTGAFVLLGKLAKIVDDFKEPQSLTRINGRRCIAVNIYKESQANTLKINNEIKSVLTDLRNNFPKVKFNIIYSQASFIKTTINNVSYAILSGAILAIATLFLFLSDWRAPLIISISIPVSVIAAFLWMKFSGIGLNIISLAGLALAGGMLVDNSIVVLENIHRYRETGYSAFDAAVSGASEVAMPITASTLTTIAVFVPVVFLKDIAAAVFTQEAKTVTYSLLASLLVSLTLLPVIYIFLEKHRKNKRNLLKESSLNVWLIKFYEASMNSVLKRENLFLLIVFLLLIISVIMTKFLDRRLLPESDQHAVEVKCDYLPGVSLDYIDKHIKRSEKILKRNKNVEYYYAELGKKQGVFLEPDERKLNRSYLYVRLNNHVKSDVFLESFKNKNFTAEQLQIEYRKIEPALSGLLGEKEAPLSVYISGSSFSILDSLIKILTKKINKIHPGAIYGSNFFERYPAISLQLDLRRLALYNLTANEIANSLKATVSGIVATQLRDFDHKIDIVLKGKEDIRKSLEKVLNVTVNGFPVRNFVNVKQTEELSYIEHKNQTRVFRLDLYAGSFNKIVNDIQKIIPEINLPSGYNIILGGEWLESRRSVRHLYYAFLMAILLVYLILAAQFESFSAPFIIMFTVPLALIGIVPALLITGMTINIMSVIGIIVIVGIVVNDGILKIDFIRRLHKKGIDINEAIHKAGKVRIRPIVMTTVTTVFGLLPLALGIGPGADIQQPMAISIIGGESVATVLTLFVLPLLYKKFTGKKH